MSPEILIPILIIGAGVLFFLLRRWGELSPPKYVPPQETKIEKTGTGRAAHDEILITHPLVRRAAEKAFAEGGKASRYIRKDGERIYLTFGAIGDPVERQKAIDMIRGIEEGGDVNIMDALQLMRHLFSR